ncbi:hypothetical protein G7009_16390 [Pseudomonas capeferrum]|uniref:hypothetical protein n=1 Tax=Pseudomonas capeferrum TaxID=1495066 RepID=UPI0015E27383|nr:hypothetical protein [Pseudomonas capeferrum]MBA1203310.1 hypothetical protein [Pseudomonas capeferrum]
MITGVLGWQIMAPVHAQVSQAERSSRFVSSGDIYQVGIYEIFEKNKDAFHARFFNKGTSR